MITPKAPTEESARRAATRSRLLEAAYEVFADVGLAAATVEQITDRAGFTRGAFYSNFTSKEQLFLALTERMARTQFDALTDSLGRLDLSGPLDEDVLAELVARVLARTTADRRWVVLNQEFWLAAVRDPAVADDFVALRRHLVDSVRDIVEPALTRSGRRFTIDPDLGSRVIVNTYLDVVRDAAVGTEQVDLGEVCRAIAVIVLALTVPVD